MGKIIYNVQDGSGFINLNFDNIEEAKAAAIKLSKRGITMPATILREIKYWSWHGIDFHKTLSVWNFFHDGVVTKD